MKVYTVLFVGLITIGWNKIFYGNIEAGYMIQLFMITRNWESQWDHFERQLEIMNTKVRDEIYNIWEIFRWHLRRHFAVKVS